MATLSFGTASYARCDDQGLHLVLKAPLFPPAIWERIRTRFTTQDGWALLGAPSRTMSREVGLDSPRWKRVILDAFTWLVFLLFVWPHHDLVKLWQAIDWTTINALCAECYHNQTRGQRAWAPAQLFALLVLFFMVPVASETALLQVVAQTPIYLWFCGFSLFTPLPDHSTLYTFRKRLGPERFEAILTYLVQCCMEAGLVANELTHFDMRGVAASAHRWTPHERVVLLTWALIRYLEQAEAGTLGDEPLHQALQRLAAEVAIEVLGHKQLQQDERAPEGVLRSLERWRQKRAAAPGEALWEATLEQVVAAYLEEADQPDPWPEEPAAQRARLQRVAQALKAWLPHARGDKDARVGKLGALRRVCGYLLGLLVDEAHNVITAVRVVPANAPQHEEMLPALDAHAQRIGSYPQAVAADSAQDYDEVHQGLEKRQVQGHIAPRTHGATGHGGFPSYRFTWNDEGALVCPAEEVLQPGAVRSDGLTPYRAPPAACAGCRYRGECLPQGQQPDGPRVLHIDPEAHRRRQANRAHAQTAAYKAAQKARFAREGVFGLLSRRPWGNKLPYRSLYMNRIAGLMMAIVHNWILLVTHGPAPGMSAD